MDNTELGMVIEVRVVHPSNALAPMAVTVEGIVLFLQPTTKVLVAVSLMANN